MVLLLIIAAFMQFFKGIVFQKVLKTEGTRRIYECICVCLLVCWFIVRFITLTDIIWKIACGMAIAVCVFKLSLYIINIFFKKGA